jgi:Cu/Ag efflux protein CusF
MAQFGIRTGAALLAVILVTSLAWAQTPPSRSKEKLVSIVAKVEAINMATREVTVKGPQGNTVTFTVDKQVARLNEIAVGDDIVADYYVSLAAELRAPTAAEKATPVVVLTETAKAPANTQPAAGALRIIRAVVTVEGLDRPTKSLTVAGPAGNMATVQVDDVAALSKLRLGDTLIVTYTEALAVSLEKRAPKK